MSDDGKEDNQPTGKSGEPKEKIKELKEIRDRTKVRSIKNQFLKNLLNKIDVEYDELGDDMLRAIISIEKADTREIVTFSYFFFEVTDYRDMPYVRVMIVPVMDMGDDNRAEIFSIEFLLAVLRANQKMSEYKFVMDDEFDLALVWDAPKDELDADKLDLAIGAMGSYVITWVEEFEILMGIEE